MKCTCTQSEYVDEDWRPFLNLDDHCPEHGTPLPIPTEFTNISEENKDLVNKLEELIS